MHPTRYRKKHVKPTTPRLTTAVVGMAAGLAFVVAVAGVLAMPACCLGNIVFGITDGCCWMPPASRLTADAKTAVPPPISVPVCPCQVPPAPSAPLNDDTDCDENAPGSVPMAPNSDRMPCAASAVPVALIWADTTRSSTPFSAFPAGSNMAAVALCWAVLDASASPISQPLVGHSPSRAPSARGISSPLLN